jgi:type IV secretory pathway VirB2 component (pilin)
VCVEIRSYPDGPLLTGAFLVTEYTAAGAGAGAGAGVHTIFVTTEDMAAGAVAYSLALQSCVVLGCSALAGE